MQNVPEISVQELQEWMRSKEPYQIVDVREAHEIRAANIGGLYIPLADILKRYKEINPNTRTVLICRGGNRSAIATQHLRAIGYRKVFNLRGGILAYAQEVDKTLQPI